MGHYKNRFFKCLSSIKIICQNYLKENTIVLMETLAYTVAICLAIVYANIRIKYMEICMFEEIIKILRFLYVSRLCLLLTG